MVKYIEKYDKQALTVGLKEKLAVIIGVVILVSSYFMFFHVDKTPYGYEDIPDNVDEYLKTSEYYSSHYKSGKMLVLYYSERDDDYEYEKSFKDALDVAMQDKALEEIYDFYPFKRLRNNLLMDDKGQKVVKGEKILRKSCRKFCIMNPKKKELYFYFEPAQRDSQYLMKNLANLEFWGIELKDNSY